MRHELLSSSPRDRCSLLFLSIFHLRRTRANVRNVLFPLITAEATNVLWVCKACKDVKGCWCTCWTPSLWQRSSWDTFIFPGDWVCFVWTGSSNALLCNCCFSNLFWAQNCRTLIRLISLIFLTWSAKYDTYWPVLSVQCDRDVC